jgi:hypothetical protein
MRGRGLKLQYRAAKPGVRPSPPMREPVALSPIAKNLLNVKMGEFYLFLGVGQAILVLGSAAGVRLAYPRPGEGLWGAA